MANSDIKKWVDPKGNKIPYLYIDKLSGVFYAVKWVSPKTIKVPLGKDFRQAKEQLGKVIAAAQSRKVPEKKNLLIRDFYKIMLDQKIFVEKRRPATITRLKSTWANSLEPFWGNLRPDQINKAKLNLFVAWHSKNKPHVQFQNPYKYLGNLFAVMAEHGVIQQSQIPKLTLSREEKAHHEAVKGRYISDDEVNRILAFADPKTWLMVKLAHCLGLRKMEIGNLEISRLKLKDGRFHIELGAIHTKTWRARIIPVPVELTGKIDEQIKRSSPSKFLFPQVRNPLKPTAPQQIDAGWERAKEKAGIYQNTRFHDLRHTCATNFAKREINSTFACQILGMSLANYQKKYLKLTSENLIGAVDKLYAEVSP